MGRAQYGLGQGSNPALASFRTGLDLLNQLGNRNSPSELLTRALLLDRLSQISQDDEHWEDSIKFLEQSVAVREEVIKHDGLTIDNNRIVTEGLRRLATAYLRINEADKALPVLQRAMTYTKETEHKSLVLNDIQRDLAETLDILIECFEQLGHPEDALRSIQEELKIRRVLLTSSSQMSDRLAYLSVGTKLAFTSLLRSNDVDGAAIALQALRNTAGNWRGELEGPNAQFLEHAISAGMALVSVAKRGWTEQTVNEFHDCISIIDQIQDTPRSQGGVA